MKIAHTPGTWYTGASDKRPAGKQVSAGYHCGHCPGYWGVGNGKVAIARVLITGCVTSREAIANARLISASPELLALVERLANINPYGDTENCELKRLARAAIAKAGYKI